MSRWSAEKEDARPRKNSASRYQSVGAITGEEKFQWPDVNTTLLRAALYTVTAHGDALSFAMSRDFASVTVTVLAGADRFKWYCRTSGELDDVLSKLATASEPV
jgi:hypothetical protein